MLFLPCACGVFFGIYDSASTGYALVKIAMFFCGAVVMRSAGCVMNDIVDRNIDKFVKRTQNRPIASGAVSVTAAILLFCILCLIGLFILLQFSKPVIIIGLIGLVLLTFYPFAKRIMGQPQFVLGLAFNIGALAGYVSMTNTISLSVAFLYIGLIYWTMIYDTIYAFQDINDDIKIGIKSTAITFGNNAKNKLKSFIATMFLCLIGAGVFDVIKPSPIYYFTLCLAGFVQFDIILKVNLDSDASCSKAFHKSIFCGIILAIGILLSKA